jgi:hypothetical protein
MEETVKVAKVIEVLGKSDKGWEDAAQQALLGAASMVRNIETIFLADYEEIFEEENFAAYHVKANVYLSYREGD